MVDGEPQTVELMLCQTACDGVECQAYELRLDKPKMRIVFRVFGFESRELLEAAISDGEDD